MNIRTILCIYIYIYREIYKTHILCPTRSCKYKLRCCGMLWHVVAPLLSPGLLTVQARWQLEARWHRLNPAKLPSDFHPPTGSNWCIWKTPPDWRCTWYVCEWTPVTNHPKDHAILAPSGSLPKHVRGKPIIHKPLSMHICALPFGASKPAKKWGQWMV